MAILTAYSNSDFCDVRSMLIDGEPWFVGKDVADILEYQNGSRDINRHTDEEDRRKITISKRKSRQMPTPFLYEPVKLFL